jgi:predicted amidohydrolase YtcJ
MADRGPLRIANATLPAGPWSPFPDRRLVHIDIQNAVIVAVHDARDRTPPGPGGAVLDVEGSCVLPGLVDTHTHLGWAAEDFWSVPWAHATSRAEALSYVGLTARRVGPGFWVTGGDWLPGTLPDSELPSLAELDAVTGERPLLLVSRDRSRAVLNSRALELCRIYATTADPAGGQIGRDERGEPTGRMYGEAVWGRIAVGAVPPRNRYRQLAELRSLLADLTRRGLTEVHDIGSYLRTDSTALINEERSFTDVTLLEQLAADGDLPIRFAYRPSLRRVADFAGLASRRYSGRADLGSPPPPGRAGPASPPSAPDALITLAGFKMSLDNGWFSEPAGPRVDSFRYPGYADAVKLCARADELGAPVSIHVIGDLGVAEALDILGHLPGRRGGNRPPHRLIHARRVRPEDARRCAELGIVIEAQPWEIVGAGRILAEGRSPGFTALLSPYRTLLDAGVTVAFGTDWRLGMRPDLADCDPLLGIQIAVTRMDPTRPGDERVFQPAQRLTVTEALQCATGAAAAAVGASARRGRVAAGCDADLVVLGGDPTTAEPQEIGRLRVELTVSAGRPLRPERIP